MSKMFAPKLYAEEVNKLISARSEVLNEYAVVRYHFHQYAAGVTGRSRCCMIYFRSFNDDSFEARGFARKGDWRRMLTKERVKEMTRFTAGKKDQGYGHVGRQVNKCVCVKFRNLVEYDNACEKWRLNKEYFNANELGTDYIDEPSVYGCEKYIAE